MGYAWIKMPFFSEEHKRRFTWKFGVIIAASFILQMVLPMAIMPLFMFSKMSGMTIENPKAVYSIKNKTLILFERRESNFKENLSKVSYGLSELKDNKLNLVPGIDVKETMILTLADERGIWMIYPDHYELFDGAKKVLDNKFKYPSPGKNPAAASDNDKLYIVYAFKNEPWLTWVKGKEQGDPIKLAAPDPKNADYCACGDQLVYWQGMLHHFARVKKDILVQTIQGDTVSEWKNLGPFPVSNYKAGYDRQGLFVVGPYYGDTMGPAEIFKGRLSFARVGKDKLEGPKIFSVSDKMMDPHLISSDTGPARIIGQSFGFSGISLMSLELDDQGPAKQTVIKRSMGPFRSFWMMPFIYAAPLLIVLILSLIATFMMPKYRTVKITLEDGVQYEFASVIVRALSQAVDGIILASPAIPAFFYVKYLLDNPDNSVFKLVPDAASGPGQMMAIMGGVMLAGFCYLAVCMLYFAVLEGKYGWTIGKLVFKVRVLGEEGKPPGFGRALLRNFLRIVDGFFNFIVGIALIAFTDNWQRVGDLAARTVVVRKKT